MADLVLVRPMELLVATRDIDWYRVAMTVMYLIVDIYALGLWWFAFRHSGLPFFRLLVVAGVIYLFFGVLHVVIACAEDRLRTDVFGYHAYYVFTDAMYIIRPLFSILALVGYTLMVRWILRSRATTEA